MVVSPKHRPIVPSIRRPNNGVRVEFSRLLIRQKDTRVVVEFEYYDRALDAEIVRVFVTTTSDPTEIGASEMAADLFFTDRPCGFRQVEKKMLCDVENELLLIRAEAGGADTFIWNHSVVPEGTTEMTLVVRVPSVLGQVSGGVHSRIVQVFENLSFLSLGLGKAPHELEGEVAFCMKNFSTDKFPIVNDIRLSACKCRRYDNLSAQKKDVQAQMVTI